jgi:peptidoglycan/xylan/chitin deacetylase (PgdA/CDA1 family)
MAAGSRAWLKEKERRGKIKMSGNPRIPYQMADERPRIKGPGGKTLIVHLVVNVEHWQFETSMPRKIKIFAERNLPASTSINAGVVDAYPASAEAMLEAGWEFIGHGFQQRSMQSEDDEAALIQAALDKLEIFTGTKTRGWLSPGLKESLDTPDILKAAGVDYVCDWVLDDLPTWMTTRHGPLMAMPYSIEVNDSIVYAIEKHSSPEMYTRTRDTVDCFEQEMADGTPRVLAIGLHPHLIGVPHRVAYLEKMLELLMARADTVFMTGNQIADWYNEADKGDN